MTNPLYQLEQALSDIQQHILQFLEQVEIREPSSSDPDRDTFAVLTGEQVEALAKLQSDYDRFCGFFLNSVGAQSIHIRVFSSIREALESYFSFQRRGTDITADMYKEFFRQEATDLIDSQINAARAACLVPTSYPAPTLTIGFEEEYFIVDLKTWKLVDSAPELIPECQSTVSGTISGEVYKCQIEYSSPVLTSVGEAHDILKKSRAQMNDIARARGYALISCATHPFEHWSDHLTSDSSRTFLFLHDMEDVVRKLLTCGLHVHVNVEDEHERIALLQPIRRYLPLLLALSANSPLADGRRTGLMSSRTPIFSGLPRSGFAPEFNSLESYHAYLNLLANTGSFDSRKSFDPTKIWWDLRPHPRYTTLEFRISDAVATSDDAVAIVALCQLIVGTLIDRLRRGHPIPSEPMYVTQENKWRATRYGRRAQFICSDLGRSVPCSFLLHEIVELGKKLIPRLAIQPQIEHLFRIFRDGNGADMQLRALREHGDLSSVVEVLSRVFVT